MAIFMFFDVLISYISRKGPFFKHFLKGKPLVIIYEGKIEYKNLKKSRLDINDLLVLCRNKNFFNLDDIEYALFETNGQISIIPKNVQKPATQKDLNSYSPQEKLPNYLITDGKISYSGLNEIGKDTDWLLKKLKITKKQLKEIIVASYDDQTDTINAQYKN